MLSVFFVVLLQCSTGHAQDMYRFLFKHLTTEQGLTGSMVTCITKDSQGFMWIGTSSGLNRYDGYRLLNYTALGGDANALPDSYILSVQEDGTGLLWIRTSSGYVVMNPATGFFERNACQRLRAMGIDVSDGMDGLVVFVDKSRNLWVSVPGFGLYYYKVQRKLMYPMPFAAYHDSGLPEGTIMTISDDGDGGVVAAYRDGMLVQVNGEMQQIRKKWDAVPKMPGMPKGTFRAFCDSKRNLWVYSPMECLYLDAATGKWTRDLPEIIKLMGWDEDFGHDVVVGIGEDPSGLLWLATARSGLIAIDVPHSRVISHLVNQPNDPRTLAGNNLQSLYVDDDGQVWVGTARRGLSRWFPSFFLFDTQELGDVNGLSFGPDSSMWVATQDKGLLNVKNGVVRRYGGLIDDCLSSVVATRNGTVWAGSSHYGLSCIAPNGQVTNYEPHTGTKGCLQNGRIEAMAHDARGNIWIGTYGGGLQCFNPQKGTFALFNVQSKKMPSDFVTSLCIRGNRMIVGTTVGVVEMNLSNNQNSWLTGTRNGEQRFTSNAVTQVLLDRRGLIWVGTRDGLNILNPETDRLLIITRGSQLANNVIQGLAEDGDGNVWVTTARGVNRLALHEDIAEPIGFRLMPTFYETADGLQDLEFNLGAITTSPTGTVFMGGAWGTNYRIEDQQRMQAVRDTAAGDSVMAPHFLPRKLNEVQVLFSALVSGGREIRAGESVSGTTIISRDVNRCDEICLPYSMRVFSLKLAVSSFSLAKHPQFLFRVVEEGEKWRPADAVTHSIDIGWLGAGRHRIEVKAVADGSMVLSEVRGIDVVIKQRLGLSWWAIMLYVIFASAIGYTIYREMPRMRRFIQRQRDAIKRLEERERTVDQLANGLRRQVVGMMPAMSRLRESVADEDGLEELSSLQHAAKNMLAQLNDLRIGVAAYLERMEENMNILVDDETDVEIDPAVYRAAMQSQNSQENDVDVDAASLQTRHSHKHNVIIVEPDADMAEFIDDCLKGTFDLRTCTSLEQVRKEVAMMRPEVVVLSHSMPGDADAGSRMCEEIKNDRTTQNVLVVLATDSVMSAAEILHAGLSLVADDYVPKPFNLKTLAWRINALLGQEQAAAPVDDTMQGGDALCSAAADMLRQQVERYVQENISRTDLSIDEMSRVIGVPRAQLFRRVQRITGLAPADYIRHLRLVEAAKLLQGGYLSAADVAAATGFPNLTMFTRFFKDEYGVQPSSYHG